MFRKTALLTAAAVLAVSTAPALASTLVQDPAAQTPPAQTQPAPASAAPAQTPQDPGSLTLQPGAEVEASDGAVLGKLEGVITVDGAQQLTVRGADGVVKGVPLAGLQPSGAGVSVGMTAAEFQAAAAVEAEASSPAASPSEPQLPAEEAPAEEPPASSPQA